MEVLLTAKPGFNQADFASYRDLAWLIRRHSFGTLPYPGIPGADKAEFRHQNGMTVNKSSKLHHEAKLFR